MNNNILSKNKIKFLSKSYGYIFYLSSLMLVLTYIATGNNFFVLVPEVNKLIQTLNISESLKKMFIWCVNYYDIAFHMFFITYIYFKYRKFLLSAKKINYNDPYINVLFFLSISGLDLAFYLWGIGALYIQKFWVTLLFATIIPIAVGIYLLRWYAKHSDICKKEVLITGKQDIEEPDDKCYYKIMEIISKIRYQY